MITEEEKYSMTLFGIFITLLVVYLTFNEKLTLFFNLALGFAIIVCLFLSVFYQFKAIKITKKKKPKKTSNYIG